MRELRKETENFEISNFSDDDKIKKIRNERTPKGDGKLLNAL